MEQPSSEEDKEVRDKAMLELLYATGIRVTELISLRVADLNLPLEYIHCGSEAKAALFPLVHRRRPPCTSIWSGCVSI